VADDTYTRNRANCSNRSAKRRTDWARRVQLARWVADQKPVGEKQPEAAASIRLLRPGRNASTGSACNEM